MTAAPDPDLPRPTTFPVVSGDGTPVRGWRSGTAGLPLLLSNGLATVPQAWPALLAPDSGYDVVSWYHRGTFGTPRPADTSRVRIEDHVDDALAVLDAAGIERALVACWSIGVNIGFALAERHPERVAGLLAVAGVPGGTFATMGAPLRVPRRLRRPLSVGTAHGLRLAGPVLTRLAPLVPVGPRAASLGHLTGLLLPSAAPEVVVPALKEFLVQDWGWYMHLALAAARHEPMDLSFVRCPTTLVAGSSDVLTSMHDVVEVAEQIADAQVTVLPGTHFLPLEHSELVHVALDELARRCDLGAPGGTLPV